MTLLDSPDQPGPPEPSAAITVFVRGEIDIASAPAVEHDLRAAHTQGALEVIVDLGGVTFMDGTGVQLLHDAQQRAGSGGYRLRLQHAPAQTQRLFRMVGLDDSYC